MIAVGLAVAAGAPSRLWAQASGDPLAARVEAALAAEPALADAAIEVDPSGSAVVLQGEVPHALARARAIEIARSVPGVQSVVDRMTVAVAERTDAQIRSDLVAALRLDPVVDRFQIGIAIDQGRVTLSGNVDSTRERLRAVEIARTLPGVVAVRDLIGVAPERHRPDDEIRAEVAGALRWDGRVDASNVRVLVSDGVVRLRGSVPSARDEARALDLAWTAGVDEVVDELAVRPAAAPAPRPPVVAQVTDPALQAAVNVALDRDPRIGGEDVTARVEDGVVVLEGTVGRLSSRWAAVATAGEVRGVERVVDRIVVSPAPRGDRAITEDVRSALRRDPWLSAYELDPIVRDGVVFLRGDVSSAFEKTRAAAVAATVQGVRAVENRIDLVVP